MNITQEQINNVKWYHEFDFPNGLKAKSEDTCTNFHKNLWEFIKTRLDTIDFIEKTVLDIGCWDGYFSFYAEKRGATSVLATDDITQNWASGQGIHLAKELLNSNIEINQNLSIYNLVSLNQTFDIILCLGVYYHLHDPFYAFSQIRHCCHKNTIIVFEGDVIRNGVPTETNYVYNDATKSIFIPSVELLQNMLSTTYLDVITTYFYNNTPHTTKSIDRALFICKPFRGINNNNYYKPPFGLHKYDPRWAENPENFS